MWLLIQVLGLFVFASWLCYRASIAYRRRADQCLARSLELVKSKVLVLITDPYSRMYYARNHFLQELAMVCARQGRAEVVRHLYQESKYSLDLYLLLEATIGRQGQIAVHRSLVISGILSVSEVRSLIWTDPEPKYRQATWQALVDMILEQGRLNFDQDCVSRLVAFCRDKDLDAVCQYLKEIQLI